LEEAYLPKKKLKLINAYPDLAGFKKTIAVGYRLNWRDPLGVNNVDLFIAGSPWSNYEDKQKIHAMLNWSYWDWHLTASFNPTNFYDIFGPTRRSRAGYSLGINYKRVRTNKTPLNSYYDLGIYTYGNQEVLPSYQNITSPISDFQLVTATYGVSKLRRTLGGVVDEKGFSWDINTTSYLAKGDIFPSIVSNQDVGFLIPNTRNTSFWIRNSIGQSFGDRSSGLSNFYFGGFRNNYVDWQSPEQYRSAIAFPGAEIDEIPAYNYLKTMGELNLRPIRLRNVGGTWMYPTYIKSSVFATHLMTNFDKAADLAHIFNVGAQMDIQLVMFSYLKTTWSVGYAKKIENGLPATNQWMLSLKLLGDLTK
jgi:hypothetical protein